MQSRIAATASGRGPDIGRSATAQASPGRKSGSAVGDGGTFVFGGMGQLIVSVVAALDFGWGSNRGRRSFDRGRASAFTHRSNRDAARRQRKKIIIRERLLAQRKEHAVHQSRCRRETRGGSGA